MALTHDSTRYEKSVPSSASQHASCSGKYSINTEQTTAKVTSGETVMVTNILFDEGSQSFFNTEKLAENLNLKYTETETPTIAAFGLKEMTLKTSTLYLNADSGEQIHVDVVPCIGAKDKRIMFQSRTSLI